MADIVFDGLTVYGCDKVAFELASGQGEQEFIIPKLQAKTVSPSASQQVITPDSGKDGLSSVTVGAISLQSKSVTANGTVSADSGYDGLGTVTVNVQPSLQDKSVAPTVSQQVISADSGYYGLDEVTVGAIQLQAKSVAPSGSQQVVTPDSGKDGLSSVTVSAIQLQTKTATQNGTVSADSGYDGLSSVSVNVPSDEGEPIECATDAEMTAVLTAANVGKVVLFTGTTGTYTNGEYYLVEASA